MDKTTETPKQNEATNAAPHGVGVKRLVSTLRYVDKKGTEVKVGDILYYDEGKGYGKGIHEVVVKDGELHGKTHLFNNIEEEWEAIGQDDIINLKYYTYNSSGDTLNDAEIIGNIFDNPEMLLKSWAEANKPIEC
jgi:hypothetical protein